MSAGDGEIGSPAWYGVQFGPQKSYREMLFGSSGWYEDNEAAVSGEAEKP